MMIPKRSEDSVLSNKQYEVVYLLANGRTKQQICTQLNIKEQTYYSHKRRVRNKTGKVTDVQIALWGVERGYNEKLKGKNS